MNFFEHQDNARRASRRLTVLFTLAVLAVLISINLVAAVGRSFANSSSDKAARRHAVYSDRGTAPLPRTIDPLSFHVGISGITLLIILGGSAFKTAQLASGGAAVALQLGGKPVNFSQADPGERVLQNVVEEMAIASGVPAPKVFVLADEKGINAFAAGFTTQDAVIGVTRGAIDRLSRDELQGVIAHEFSHILNGDMRLNMRMIGVLYGILVLGLTGRLLLQAPRFSGDQKSFAGTALIAVLGGFVWLIGSIGLFCGRLIQAAISRQREFLADASAVQFTRNPSGIAGALKKLGGFSEGSAVHNSDASEMAHLFFGSRLNLNFNRLLATHPPLAERIRAIDSSFDGTFLQSSVDRQTAVSPNAVLLDVAAEQWSGFSTAGQLSPPPLPQRGPISPGRVMPQVGRIGMGALRHATMLLSAIPPELRQRTHEAFSARAVVLCVLLSADVAERRVQLAAVAAIDPPLAQEVTNLWLAVAALGPAGRLPLIELSLPSLGELSENQRQAFGTALVKVVRADGRVTLFETAVYRTVASALFPPPVPGMAETAHTLKPLLPALAVVLSALAEAADSDTDRAFAAGAVRFAEPMTRVARVQADDLDAALQQLARASLGVRRRVVDAAAHCVAADGEIAVAEAEVIRAVAAVLGCPLPPLLRRDDDP